MSNPTPTLDGLAASTLQLPPGSWTTVLDCLCAHFTAIPREQWLDRMQRGRVLDGSGHALTPESAYRPGLRVHYFREVADEVVIPFLETILHADEDLVVADKPHFLPVTPVGSYVEQTLLVRLIRRLANPDLVPLHRIDRGTAGLVLFSANPATRSRYQALFREQKIRKRYQAIAPRLPNSEFPQVRRTRIVRGEPFFLSQEIDGQANAETRIEVIEKMGAHWRYALSPISGKKHQLRLHMAALGAAIVNDDFYPRVLPRAADDFSAPLQLLAQGLEFVDPLSGVTRQFESGLRLSLE